MSNVQVQCSNTHNTYFKPDFPSGLLKNKTHPKPNKYLLDNIHYPSQGN